MTQDQEDRAIDLLLQLLTKRVVEERRKDDSPDLRAARALAGHESRQTGKNLKNFINGNYDYAYGVRCVLAGIDYGRRNG